ncbi:MAG: hypothetical protein AABY18_05995 [Candidatus Thermoplasmatota archaeon]
MPEKPAARKAEKPVGKVEHYYPKAKAAAVGLTDDLKLGDEIHIVGHGDDVRTKVKSLQLDHAPIAAGHAGQHIGVGLAKKVHEGDAVLLVGADARGAAKAAKPRPKAAKAARKPARKPKRAKAAKRAKKAARKPAKAGRKAPKRKAKTARR